MEFCAAATLPVTTMTVIYALGHLAQLKPGERVLIHGGLGGVGLAAIQYASYRGAEIYATAGSADRRALLKSLGVQHVFDSRTAAFADEIRAATGGQGVDVVLNSLSGELMQQSLKLMRPFGRFLEIGKRDLFANSEIGLRPLRHNVTYYAVDADQLPLLAPELASTILEWTAKFLAAGDMRGLPYRAYAASDIVDAFRLMQGSGHIGKVIIVPDTPQPAPITKPDAAFAVRGDRTYLVTGGAGGFGLETARWLADRGARHLALLSRQGPATPGVETALDAFKAQGVDARVYACDVSEEADLAGTLAEIRVAQPPLAGVVHAAVVMDDGLLGDLNTQRFAASLRAKLDGASALDRLTRSDPIELFVLYSSISSAIGNPGQGNYVAGNAAMEAIALRRAAEGLPALAVQWGPISDAGFLARDTRTRELIERVMASGELTARTALDALPGLIETGLPVAGFAVADWSQLKRQMPIGATPLMAESADEDGARTSESSIRDQIINLPSDEAHALAEAFLVDEVSEILRLDRHEVDVERPISQMGFDSLMMLELHLAVESRLRVELPLMSVGGGATLRSIANRVVRNLRAEGEREDEAEDIEDHMLRHEGVTDDAMVDPAE
jgi:NADPH:quinone reductase-like Zn-dependent oxidoreductase/acyl carrier protein